MTRPETQVQILALLFGRCVTLSKSLISLCLSSLFYKIRMILGVKAAHAKSTRHMVGTQEVFSS